MNEDGAWGGIKNGIVNILFRFVKKGFFPLTLLFFMRKLSFASIKRQRNIINYYLNVK